MNSLGWSRREPDLPVNTAQQTGGLLSSIKSLNPWGDAGHVRLPTTEGSGAPLPGRNRREEEETWFACESEFSVAFSFRMSHYAHLTTGHVGCGTSISGGWIFLVLLGRCRDAEADLAVH